MENKKDTKYKNSSKKKTDEKDPQLDEDYLFEMTENLPVFKTF